MSALFGVNYWPSYSGPQMWRDFRPDLIEADLRALKAQGVQYLRFNLFWPDFMPTPEQVEPVMLDRLEQFLLLLGKLGLKGQMSLLVGHMSGENWPPPWLDEPARLYSDPGLLAVQEFYLRSVVERVRHCEGLEGYILSNEMPHFTGPAKPEQVRGWAERLYGAIRVLDPQRPIGTGDGVWYTLAPSNGFSSDLPHDFLGPHGYESDTHPERLLAAYGLAVSAAQAVAAGRPVWLEEFGAPHSVHGEAEIATWASKVVLEARLQGAERICWWCGVDFNLPLQNPYHHHAYEQTFGLLRRDHSVRPVAKALREACAAPLPRLPEVGLLVSSFQHQSYPFHLNTESDYRLTTQALRNAYAALRHLGYKPQVVFERQLLGGECLPGLLVVPSVQKLLAPTWKALERFRGRVIYSYYHGSQLWYGAWMAEAESFFGGKPRNRFGLPEEAPAQLVYNGTAWDLPGHPDPFVTTPLLLEPARASVQGIDPQGRPLWLRLDNRDLLLYPVEALAPDPTLVASIYRDAFGLGAGHAVNPMTGH